GLAIQPRGLREKSCTASQPVSLAITSDSCRPPFIGAWKPIFGRLFFVCGVGIRFPLRSFANTFAFFALNIPARLKIFNAESAKASAKGREGLFLLDFFHDTQHVAAQNLVDITFRITTAHEFLRQIR